MAGAWWVTDHGFAKSWTQLSDSHTHTHTHTHTSITITLHPTLGNWNDNIQDAHAPV